MRCATVLLVAWLSLPEAFAADPPIWRGPLAGGVTSTSAVVKAKLRYRGASARLLVSTNVDLSAPLFFGPATALTEQGNMVEFHAAGLRADTQYFYALEVNGALQASRRAAFKTFPSENEPASFNFAFASCARTGSENPVFHAIRLLRPLFYMNVGDFHYLDIRTNHVTVFRMGYDRVLASPPQDLLYRSLPLVYMWDDHDYAGNNSNRRASAQDAARRIYEEYVPHYPLAGGGGEAPIYQSFTVGRVKFIVTDLRSERDESSAPDAPRKSMMGAKQKAWFKNELLAAKDRHPLIFWVTTVPWLGRAGVNYYPLRSGVSGFIHQTNRWQFRADPTLAEDAGQRRFGGDDHWGRFDFERREIISFLAEHKIGGVAILHGDAHSVAADNGTSDEFANSLGVRIPVMAAAPLDQDASIKGGPYSQGIYKPVRGEGCFGFVQVRDDGRRISVYFSGRNNRNEEKISLRFAVP